MNRIVNWGIRVLFRHGYNDTTNAFKAYRREVIENVQPFLSHHFNLTVELPLKAVVRGYSYGIVPISWTQPQSRGLQAAPERDGQPLPLHRPLRLPRAPPEPRRLPPRRRPAADVRRAASGGRAASAAARRRRRPMARGPQAAVDYERLYDYRFRQIDQGVRRTVSGPAIAASYVRDSSGAPAARSSTPPTGRCRVHQRCACHGSAGPSTTYRLSRGRAAPGGDEGRDRRRDHGRRPPGRAISTASSSPISSSTCPGRRRSRSSSRGCTPCMRDGRGASRSSGRTTATASGQYWDFADHTVALTERGVAEHLYAAGFELV